MEKVKQVIVLRKDLNMRKGKMCVQAAHASMAVILDMMERYEDEAGWDWVLPIGIGSAIQKWLTGKFTKICVSVNSEDELKRVYELAKNKHNLPASYIIDSGLTEFKEPTATAVAIGPWWSDEIDRVTGELKLL